MSKSKRIARQAAKVSPNTFETTLPAKGKKSKPAEQKVADKMADADKQAKLAEKAKKAREAEQVAAKAKLDREADRKAKAEARAADKDAARRDREARKAAANKPYARRKDGTLSARGLTCLCGCNGQTVTNDARFISGHDAKLRVAILTTGNVPKIVQPFFDNGEMVAGLSIEDGEVTDHKVVGSIAA